EIARQVEPAVVNISTVKQPARRTAVNEFPMPRPSFEGLQFGQAEQQPAQRGNGSGVIVDAAAGYILTNRHVILGADRIKVRLFNGIELPGRLIGSDRETDLAVIKVEPTTRLTAARFGDSEKTRVGDWVLAIGSPFGFDQTVTAGIISARERESEELYNKVGFQYFLQTDAAVNRGNSGGPLINIAGEVIGINTAIATSTGDYNGISFALPSSEAVNIYKQLVKQGRVVRGFLGALTERVTPQIARVFGLPVSHGAIVSNVSETMEVDGMVVESPAAKAGLRLNDVIIEIRNESVRDDADLIRRIASTPVGTQIPMKIVRDGQAITLNVVVGRRPGGEPAKLAEVVMRKTEDELPKTANLGITFQALTPQRIREKELEVKQGVFVVKVEAGSVADDARLKAGDVISHINRIPVKSNEDFKRVLSELNSGDPIVLQIYREKLLPTPSMFISLNKP
ncbi:MAG: Do family serine endopeptidase, partial [Blastocatellia bacterium]|nr:Do family serine endopeptidase [Blastocatellia bacterium]